MSFFKRDKKILFLIFFFVTLASYKVFAAFKNASTENFDFSSEKIVTINDNGLIFEIKTSSTTVEDLLKENKINLNDYDQIIPKKSDPLFPGTGVEIKRAVKIKIEADGKTIESWTLQKSVLAALSENNIALGNLDKVTPDADAAAREDQPIIITRINIEEKVIREDIDFKTAYRSDSQLGWRKEKITQAGEKGTREVKYRVTYKNGKETSRIVLEKNVIKEPVPEIITKGTYMKLGRADKGQGTWYAFKGGMFAASTSLPRGSYAKVTNLANGKSVVVQINDYGPFGKGRIIDLDKVAFAKIAPLGAGVIGVKVEQILN